MYYVKYQESNGYVISITEEIPKQETGFKIGQTSELEPGDEYTYHITVMRTDDDGYILATASVQQAPQAQYLVEQLSLLRKEKDLLEAENQSLKERTQAAEDAILLLMMEGMM